MSLVIEKDFVPSNRKDIVLSNRKVPGLCPWAKRFLIVIPESDFDRIQDSSLIWEERKGGIIRRAATSAAAARPWALWLAANGARRLRG